MASSQPCFMKPEGNRGDPEMDRYLPWPSPADRMDLQPIPVRLWRAGRSGPQAWQLTAGWLAQTTVVRFHDWLVVFLEHDWMIFPFSWELVVFLEPDWMIFPETVGNFIIPTDEL